MGSGQRSTLTGQHGQVSNGPVGLRVGPVWARHVAGYGTATSRPWALIGLHPQRGSHRVAHGGPALMVHGPTAGRMVDQVHRLFSLARLTCTEPTHKWPVRGGVFPCFLPRRCSRRRRAPGEPPWQCWCPIGEGKNFPGSRRLRLWGQGAARASPRCWPRRSVARRGGARRRPPSSGVGVQLRWATARPYHGECPGDASEVAGRLLLAGRGGGARRSSGRGPVLVARVLWPAIDDSVHAANLQASW